LTDGIIEGYALPLHGQTHQTGTSNQTGYNIQNQTDDLCKQMDSFRTRLMIPLTAIKIPAWRETARLLFVPYSTLVTQASVQSATYLT
jgi:hypothetical protein